MPPPPPPGITVILTSGGHTARGSSKTPSPRAQKVIVDWPSGGGPIRDDFTGLAPHPQYPAPYGQSLQPGNSGAGNCHVWVMNGPAPDHSDMVGIMGPGPVNPEIWARDSVSRPFGDSVVLLQ
jgi:hypothetical protein